MPSKQVIVSNASKKLKIVVTLRFWSERCFWRSSAKVVEIVEALSQNGGNGRCFLLAKWTTVGRSTFCVGKHRKNSLSLKRCHGAPSRVAWSAEEEHRPTQFAFSVSFVHPQKWNGSQVATFWFEFASLNLVKLSGAKTNFHLNRTQNCGCSKTWPSAFSSR